MGAAAREDGSEAPSSSYVTPGAIGACLTIIPNATLWYGLSRGSRTPFMPLALPAIAGALPPS